MADKPLMTKKQLEAAVMDIVKTKPLQKQFSLILVLLADYFADTSCNPPKIQREDIMGHLRVLGPCLAQAAEDDELNLCVDIFGEIDAVLSPLRKE